MKLYKTTASFAICAGLIIGTFPQIASARIPSAIRASSARCERLAGRAKTRCENIHNRKRLRLHRGTSTATQTNRPTLRGRRATRDNTSSRDLRSRIKSGQGFNRRSLNTQGRTRRRLRRTFGESRAVCRSIENSTERALCIKKNVQKAQSTDYSRIR